MNVRMRSTLKNPTNRNTTPTTRMKIRGRMSPIKSARKEGVFSSRTMKQVAVSSSADTTLAATRVMVISSGTTQATA